MRITILSENYTPFSLKLRGEHGFCALIEKDDRQFLFDTGRFGVCVDNADAMKIDLTKVEKILLSHGHIDHTGGLEVVLKTINHPVEIVAHPKIFEEKFIVGDQYVKSFGRPDVFIGVTLSAYYLEKMLNASFNLQEGFCEVGEGVWLTGEVPFTNGVEKIPESFLVERGGIRVHDDFADDNSLLIDTGSGLVVVLGCAHRGIVNILTYAKKKLNKKIRAVIGGTHLHGAPKEQIEFAGSYLKELFENDGVELFAPAHCTGIDTIIDFCTEFKDIAKPAFCGAVFEF
jgi:7,8-dihydropterin-6-yl-methyl-4-(beta-D-ribofuranosyl)aminobenzene 5'-phosphate synthase